MIKNQSKIIKELGFGYFYHKFNQKFLQLLLNQIKKDNFLIADYGGGNSILSKKLISMLIDNKLKHFQIENIDSDNTAFVIHPRIINIYENILTYIKKDRYDYSLCRFLLHYFDEENQLKILKNINQNLKDDGYLLLINFVLDNSKDYETKLKILDLIELFTKISKRTIPTSQSVRELCKKAGFEIVDEIKVNYNISLNGFYKKRFNLTEHQITEIANTIKEDTHLESQLCLLLKKVATPLAVKLNSTLIGNCP